MAKGSRFATTRISASLIVDGRPDENVKDSFYLDGRLARKREEHGADISSTGEDRGFFYAVFATNDFDFNNQGSATVSALQQMTEAVKQSTDKIDNEINDLADCAVEVGGRATISREGIRQSYFAGIILKEAEIAAVTRGNACAFLYRNSALYPLTNFDYDFVNADYHGNAVDHMMDFAAGVAGTIRYSNIAQVQAGDVILLCNKEVLEAAGQREVISNLYEQAEISDAAADIIDAARAGNDNAPMQVLLIRIDDVIPADKTSKLNIAPFQSEVPSQATTRYEPINVSQTAGEKATVDEDAAFKPDYPTNNSHQVADNYHQETYQEPASDDPFKPDYNAAASQTPDTTSSQVHAHQGQRTQRRPHDQGARVHHGQEDLPVFEPIVTTNSGGDDDFAGGQQYVDDGYAEMSNRGQYDDYSDDWEDDQPRRGRGRRNPHKDYYDEDDDFGLYDNEDKGSQVGRIILYVVLGLIIVACLYAIARMTFLKKDDSKKPDATKPTEVTVETTKEEDVKTKIREEVTTSERSELSTSRTDRPDRLGSGGEHSEDNEPRDINRAGSGALSGKVKVSASGVNMRQGPSTNTDIIGVYDENETVEIIEAADNNWYKVKTSNGTEAYILGDYLKK